MFFQIQSIHLFMDHLRNWPGGCELWMLSAVLGIQLCGKQKSALHEHILSWREEWLPEDVDVLLVLLAVHVGKHEADIGR